MRHAVLREPGPELGGEVGRPVVAQQARSMLDADALEAGTAQGDRQSVRDIGRGHGRTQLPGQDVAREVIQHGRQIEPAPTDYPEVGKIGLPELIGSSRWLGVSAAFIRMKAGLVIRSCAFKSR